MNVAAILKGKGRRIVSAQPNDSIETVVGILGRERIGALIVDYLEQALETLSAQARTFADESWLRKQDASELAVLHGVLADKTIRILEALAESPHDES